MISPGRTLSRTIHEVRPDKDAGEDERVLLPALLPPGHHRCGRGASAGKRGCHVDGTGQRSVKAGTALLAPVFEISKASHSAPGHAAPAIRGVETRGIDRRSPPMPRLAFLMITGG